MGVDIPTYAAFAAAMVASPGPANMVLLSAGARYGLRPAIPFLGGVILGKQLIIWPIGFGLMQIAQNSPLLFLVLKWLAALYVVWLAWTIARGAIRPANGAEAPPGFSAGLLVHPLNPKAWVMISAGFTSFTTPDTPAFAATLAVAAILLVVQVCLQPCWCMGGAWLAARLSGTAGERWLMIALAAMTLGSVALVLAKGP